MIISKEKPDCWDRLEAAFGVRWESGVIVTWKGVVHTIRGELSPDLIIHEEVHLKQQAEYGSEEFLERFINDKQFRYDMEIPAFMAQADYLRHHIKNPDELFCKLHLIHKNMEQNYGGMITYEEAKKII